MKFIDTPEMEKLWAVCEPFLTHSHDPANRFIKDTPKEAVEAFEKWCKLRGDQRKRAIAEFFA